MEWINDPKIIDLIAAAIFLAAACAGLVKGFYKQIMPLAVIVLSGLGAVALSASLTTPVTELIYPKIVELVVHDDGDGLDWQAIARDAGEQISPLVPRKLLRDLDAAERAGVLGDTITEIFSDAADNGLGEAVNDALGSAAESEAAETLRGVGETVGNLSETAGEAISGALDAARDGAVGGAIDSALDTAASGAVGDAVNDAVSIARAEIEKAVAVRTAAYVHLILLCVLWALLMAVLSIVKNTLGIAAKLPVVKQVDKLGGAALGLVECALAFWCLGWLDRATGFGWLAQQAEGTVFLRLFV